jgi:hypothetical protein
MATARAAFAVIASAAIALSAATIARAQDGANPELAAFTQRMFAGTPTKAKTYACFTRVYDADHLARHKLQKVSAMKLLVTAEQEAGEPMQLSFRMGLKYRTRAGDFDSSGSCGNAQIEEGWKEPRIGCSVDCDGGGIGIALTPDNKSAMLRVERVRIWRHNKPDDEASATSLVGGADDRVFRLDRTGIEQCASLAYDRKELAAMRHVSNRR